MTSFAQARFLETISSLRAIAGAASANFVLGVETPSQQKLWILKGESFKGAVRIDAFDLRLEDNGDATFDDDHFKVETFDAVDWRNDDSSPMPTKLLLGYSAPGIGDEGEVSSSVATLVDAASVEPLSATPNAIDELDSEFIILDEPSTVLQNVSNKDELTDNLRLIDENSTKTTTTSITTSLPPRIRSERRPQGFKRSHECLDCGRIFTRRVFLDRHRESLHLKTKKHFCSRCNRGFYLASNLENHFCDNHGDDDKKDDKNDDESAHAASDFPCSSCRKSFSQLASLRRHILHHHLANASCDLCGATFSSRADLRLHVKERHEKEKKFPCCECDKSFALKQLLKRHHQAVHLNIKNYICPLCGFGFYASGSLKNHIWVVHDKRRDHTCHVCAKTFVLKGNLRRHLATAHDEGTERRHVCGDCGKAFKLKHYLQQHYQMVHLKVTDSCRLCGKKILAKSMYMHLKSVHEKRPEDEWLKCNQCDKTFENHPKLSKHVEGVHRNLRPFECQLCQKRFKYAAVLADHKKAIHDKIKDFTCDICGKAFGKECYRRNHVRIVHDRVQDFVCPHCDRKFSLKDNLKKHVRAIHECRRDYSCAQCGRTFNDRSNLNQHVKIVHYNIKRTPKKKASAAAATAAADVSSLCLLEVAPISIEPEVFV